MSQLIWKINDTIKVITGWDKPLQHHFLYIEDLTISENDDHSEIMFSDIDHGIHGMTINQITDKLKEFGFPYPPTLPNDLNAHYKRNAGNEMFHYPSIEE